MPAPALCAKACDVATLRRTVKLLVEHEDTGDQELRAVLLSRHEGHNGAVLRARDVGRLRDASRHLLPCRQQTIAC